MTKQEITDKIHGIICNKFMIEKKEIPLESTFNSFGADSLDIIIDIEKDFKIFIPGYITFQFHTTTKIADFIASVVEYIDMIINKHITNNSN